MAVPLPLVNTGDVITVTYEGFHDEQRILSTFNYSVEEIPATPVSYTEAYQSFNSKFFTEVGSFWSVFQTCMTSDYQLTGVRYQAVHPIRIPYVRFNVNSLGTVDPPSLPPNCAVSITRRGGVIGPQGAGRLQCPAVPIAAVVAGRLVGGLPAVPYFNMAAEMLNDITAVTGEGNIVLAPVLFNPAKAEPPTPATVKYLFDTDVQLESRTQRTRTVGQGE